MFMAKGVTSVVIEFERYPLTQHFKGNNYDFDIVTKVINLLKMQSMYGNVFYV